MEDKYSERILSNWEEVFKQGLLTFWLFIALNESSLSVKELKLHIQRLTNQGYDPAEQTLYRSLRNHCQLNLVKFQEVDTKGGPKTKLYSLTELGQDVLYEFAGKNISLFYQPSVKKIIKG